MNDDASRPAPDAAADAAARWFARELAGPLDDDEARALRHWRAERAEHEREYQALRGLWSAAAGLPASRLRALATPAADRDPPLASSAPVPVPDRGRRRWLAASTSLGLVLGGAALWHRQAGRPQFSARIDTPRGQRRTLHLPDGSQVEANTDTRLEVALFADRRLARLEQGEAYFQVAPDAGRPFDVEAGHAQVHVVGTRFVVRRDGDRVQTSVLEGRVRLGPQDAGLLLDAGWGATVDSRDRPDARRVDVAAAAAWREGRIVFDDTPLAEALAELARYAPYPTRLAEPALGRLRLSGSFRADDPEALLRALPAVLPVRVRRLDDGSAEVSAR